MSDSFVDRTQSHSFVISHPTSHPSYGINSTAESGFYGDDYYEEEGEDDELEEELAKLEEYFGCECHPVLSPAIREGRVISTDQ